MPPRSTPRGIRRRLVEHVDAPSASLLPPIAHSVVLIGALDHVTVTVPHVRVRSARDLREAHAIHGIAGVLVDTPRNALANDGLLAALLAERPELPRLVSRLPRSADETHDVTNAGFEIGVDASEFAVWMTMEADFRRRVLDQRAVGWKLSPREAQIVWLASMIVSIDRVARLFGSKGFHTQLASTRAKVGATSFEHLGRLARG